jgi:hypothetical protein
VHHDAAKEGKAERASGEGSSATSEKGGELNKKAEKDHKEAPRPVIGMNDERGGVSFTFLWRLAVSVVWNDFGDKSLTECRKVIKPDTEGAV